MIEARWWSFANLGSTEEQIWPENLTNILVRVGVGLAGR
jgi:hypothetical protein